MLYYIEKIELRMCRMKKMVLMLLALVGCVVLAAETTPTKRVLFIGNSYTLDAETATFLQDIADRFDPAR